ncbi:hypothetical protein ACF0H5_021651 [Mactra antiquata]
MAILVSSQNDWCTCSQSRLYLQISSAYGSSTATHCLQVTQYQLSASLLNTFSSYCDKWKLNINFDKTKIMVFGDRNGRKRDIRVNGNSLEIVDSFKYLGVVFSKNRKFALAKKHVVEQARKALFSLLKKIRNLDLSVDCQLKFFDQTVLPIITFNCDIWAIGDLSMSEKIHTDFMKQILHVKRSTPHVMLYGDLGRFPISITIKKRIVSFRCNLISSNNKLSSLIYQFIYSDSINNNYPRPYSWLHTVKSIIDECGLSYVWLNQNFHGTKSSFLHEVENSLKNQYIQSWQAEINTSQKCLNYKIFKTEHKLEHYFDILPLTYIQTFVNYRMGNNRFPIETGRWQNVPRHERKCIFCTSNEIGDAFHYLFNC